METMRIEEFTENDIREAAALAYSVWGVGHAGGGKDILLSKVRSCGASCKKVSADSTE
ncbi:MAG: hypothetical protein IIV72_00205 [Alistipes sp.]|nr:hypothetical protein [Alistipes sp.]